MATWNWIFFLAENNAFPHLIILNITLTFNGRGRCRLHIDIMYMHHWTNHIWWFWCWHFLQTFSVQQWRIHTTKTKDTCPKGKNKMPSPPKQHWGKPCLTEISLHVFWTHWKIILLCFGFRVHKIRTSHSSSPVKVWATMMKVKTIIP